MSKRDTHNPTTGGQCDNHSRDCDRCGRPRPANIQRFAVTASDHTNGTVDYEKALLCGNCWRHIRDELRGAYA